MTDQKKVTQEELRRLMKEKSSASKTKITSQYAKYNTLDQLTCSICGTIIKNEKLWNAHLLSKTHKENLVKPAAPAKLPVKRTHEIASIPTDHKKLKSENLPVTKSALSHKSILTNGDKETTGGHKIQLGSYASSDDESDEEADNGGANQNESIQSDVRSASVAPLPAGFFDDPRLDAKARNVQYKDKQEEEMEKFQKEIKEIIETSENLNEGDFEEGRIDRTIEDIDENMARWKHLYSIIEKKKSIVTVKPEKKAESNSDEDDEDEDEDDITGQTWRGK